MPTLSTPEVDLNYHAVSDGDDVVLIHGLGANLAFWYLGVGRAISDKHRVVMYDLRGHGTSSMPPTGYTLLHMADDLRNLLDHLGITRAHVVGHSYGARVALSFAGRYPERTRTLTVADTQLRTLQPSMRLRDWPHWENWKRDLVSRGLEALPSDDEQIDFRLLTQLSQYGTSLATHGARQVKRRQVSVRKRDMGAKGSKRWEQLLEATSAKNELEEDSLLSEDFLRGISAPTLLMFGRLSHCLPTAKALERLIPNASTVIVPGVGHFFPAVKPQSFVNAFTRFTGSELSGEQDVPKRRRGVARPGLAMARRARRAGISRGEA